MSVIADVQSTPDVRNLPINQVGIKNIRFPMALEGQDGLQHTIARLNMSVRLPADQKGTHMSRFVALLEDNRITLNLQTLQALTEKMLVKLDAEAGLIEIDAPYFMRKRAPVTGIESLMDYDVLWRGEITAQGYTSTLRLKIPVTSLCPCSKEISEYGAHNQRSEVTVTLVDAQGIRIEEIIGMVENEASCALYGLLKRPDEKYVTERAYENPKFVEDMVRDVAKVFIDDRRIAAFSVESENFESIHNHSAYARIDYPVVQV